MKYLKYLLILIVVLAVGFFLLGLIKPTLTYDSEVIVDKAHTESWAVTHDVEKLAEWLPGFLKVEHISGTPGTVGAVSNVYFENKGQEMTVQETIVDIVPDKSISMTFTDDFMNMDYKMSVTPLEGKTKIGTTTTAVGNSWISRSIMVLVGSTIEEQEHSNLANLKKAIEQNTKDYFPVVDEVLEVGENKE